MHSFHHFRNFVINKNWKYTYPYPISLICLSGRRVCIYTMYVTSICECLHVQRLEEENDMINGPFNIDEDQLWSNRKLFQLEIYLLTEYRYYSRNCLKRDLDNYPTELIMEKAHTFVLHCFIFYIIIIFLIIWMFTPFLKNSCSLCFLLI